jgi:hypothetical protein
MKVKQPGAIITSPLLWLSRAFSVCTSQHKHQSSCTSDGIRQASRAQGFSTPNLQPLSGEFPRLHGPSAQGITLSRVTITSLPRIPYSVVILGMICIGLQEVRQTRNADKLRLDELANRSTDYRYIVHQESMKNVDQIWFITKYHICRPSSFLSHAMTAEVT